MKRSFMAFSLLVVTLTLTFVACSKKDWLPNDEKDINVIKVNPGARSDTPYEKSPIYAPVKDLVVIPVAKNDTPYGKVKIVLPDAVIDDLIKVLPASRVDTPYGN